MGVNFMKEEDIRPEQIFEEYLSLARKDADNFFRKAPFYYGNCPACGISKSSFQFRKMGFDYEECTNCGTLFVNPRPTAESFSRYYEDSPSVRFWATNFYKETEAKRREHLIRPKAALVKQYLKKYSSLSHDGGCILDIGSGYGTFCEELQLILPELPVVGVEPAISLQEVCREKNIPVIPKFFEEMTEDDCFGNEIVAATSFELLEHLHDPDAFIANCSRLMKPGALLIMTTLTWDGFDLQVLRKHSNSIHPPHHINFFTKESISLLLHKYGFKICEIVTPGKLDVDLVAKKIEYVQDPFIKSIVSGDDEVKQQFQEFLQKAGMSSHMMIVMERI